MTPTVSSVASVDVEAIAAALDEARAATLALLAPLDESTLARRHSELMSPLVWDLAHVAHYEELWLLRELGGAAPTEDRFDDIYDAFKHPRKERTSLDLLGPAEAFAFATDVRARVVDRLGAVTDWSDAARRAEFVHAMVIQHEHQHRETMLATLQLRDRPYPIPRRSTANRTAPTVPGEIELSGGTFTMGTDDTAWSYDNERPAHPVTLAPFRIDATPVTNQTYLEFIRAGGYHDELAWTEAGRAWRDEAGLTHPQYWREEPDGSWVRRRFGHWEPLPPDEPVQHVCFYEADAFARWADKRLPTEAEWEYAAAGSDVGAANLSGTEWAPDAVDSHPDGVSDRGVHQMLGDVWEWTSTTFSGYPGFASFPYREYSEVFFDDGYRVLRGGSWATHRRAIRTTFRNWDFPIRRQIFAGFRCARDGSPTPRPDRPGPDRPGLGTTDRPTTSH